MGQILQQTFIITLFVLCYILFFMRMV